VKNKLHPGKLARALRLLATHHVFTEVSPDVFTNNWLSSALDTGKSTEALFTQPKVDKFKGSTGICPLIESTVDAKKCSVYFTEALTDPATSHSEDPSGASCLRFFKTKSLGEYIYAPGNEHLSARHQAAMTHSGLFEGSAVVPGGFPWETLPEGTRIVDVGAGVGSACRQIMEYNPLLKFTVQDLPSVCDQAIAYWNHYDPALIADGRVTIQAHDFFTPQPVRDADIFLLRYITHDWPDLRVIEILKHLREAVVPGKTKVVVIDAVIQYACAADRKPTGEAGDIVFEGPGKNGEVPAGLLPNLGRAAAGNYFLDLMMMTVNNGKERTAGDLARVMDASGWKIEKIYSPRGSRLSHVLAEAV